MISISIKSFATGMWGKLLGGDSWTLYDCYWQAEWVWVPDWVWIGTSYYIGGKKIEDGHWEDHGDYEDWGNWVFYSTDYNASISGSMDVWPDAKVPTAVGKTMKSGYGINVDAEARIYTNAGGDAFTPAQTMLSYFPEFEYETYWRLSDWVTSGIRTDFQLQVNPYSSYDRRSHFVPVWFPDDSYRVYGRIFNAWTPAGMLEINRNDYVTISGNVFDDWHSAVLDPKR